MIYKAAPIRAHRVQFSTAQTQFIPTSGFGTPLSDLSVLSHFNENQSMVHQYPSGNYPPSSHNTNLPCSRYTTPFMAQTTTAAQHRAPTVALTSPNPGFHNAYTPSDASTGHFEQIPQGYEVPTNENGYGSSRNALNDPIPFFHPPMLLPPHLCSSPPAASPVSSLSPGPSPGKRELQIRLSQPCYEMGQRHHEILPLETGPFKK
jgi:hypothetical protein